MGSFLQNAQQAVVPLALYSAYRFMPKKSRNIFSLNKKRGGKRLRSGTKRLCSRSRRNSRNSRSSRSRK
jgi:hypothetical protein